MRKTRKTIILLTTLTLMGGVSLQPALAARQEAGIVSPQYISIEKAMVTLSRETSRKILCIGFTYVSSNYIAGIAIDLQASKDGENWTTVQKWNERGGNTVEIREPYTTSSGYYYRLKSVHSSYDKNGKLIESQTKYSNVVK